ncbi:MAG TPA: hypothetical protein VG407_08415 [Caulobacteraceae bacterium]|jgi:hypothetical protein|nr:hypothetical protein [Caulobacteraceae bacterium]
MHRRLFLSAVMAPLAAPLLAAPAFAQEGEGRKKEGGATFIPIRTMTANTVRADGRRGVFTVEAGIDAPDPNVNKRVQATMPLLVDAYADTVRIFAGALRPGQVPDLDLLENRLQADTDRILRTRGARLLLGTCLVN